MEEEIENKLIKLLGRSGNSYCSFKKNNYHSTDKLDNLLLKYKVSLLRLLGL